jgi:hypothetical protein
VICVLCFDGVCVVGGPTFCPLLGDVSVVPVCVLCCGCGKKKKRLKALQPGPKSCHENLSTHAVMLTDDDDHFDSDITFAFEAHICS